MAVLPTINTPLARCEEKSLHTQAMLSRFADVPALNGLGTLLATATNTLLARQAELQQKTKALILLRVEVTWCDRSSDQLVRAGIKRAEIADGKPGGRITTTLFPNGSTPIIKPVGTTQVNEMVALAGRYESVASIYPEATEEVARINASRVQYENALEARKSGIDAEAQSRAARNLAKEEFLDVFAEVAARIKGAFPRDKKTQDLFFLKDKSTTNDADDDDGDSEGNNG